MLHPNSSFATSPTGLFQLLPVNYLNIEVGAAVVVSRLIYVAALLTKVPDERGPSCASVEDIADDVFVVDLSISFLFESVFLSEV
nr:hypothetical protein HmN_000960700 [Hymenolepis microstoma]